MANLQGSEAKEPLPVSNYLVIGIEAHCSQITERLIECETPGCFQC